MNASRLYLSLAILVTAAILIALCIRTPAMRALRRDSPANFWYATTGIDIGATSPDRPFQSEVIFDRGRFVYGRPDPFGYDDLPYESVSEAQAAVDFPRIQAELEKRSQLNDPDDYVATGFKKWPCAISTGNGGIPGLLDCIYAARLDWFNRRLPAALPVVAPNEFQQGLKHVAKADRLYWACFVFEALYLPAVAWFCLWPFIRRARFRRKLLTLAAVPLLLVLPNWFGYCNSASRAFPRGGILYPYICGPSLPFPDNYAWEFKFLAALPPFLTVITQGRPVTFADYFSLRKFSPYQNGPVKIALNSLALMSAFAACHLAPHIFRKLRNRRQYQGFPVCDVHPNTPPPTPNPQPPPDPPRDLSKNRPLPGTPPPPG